MNSASYVVCMFGVRTGSGRRHSLRARSALSGTLGVDNIVYVSAKYVYILGREINGAKRNKTKY